MSQDVEQLTKQLIQASMGKDCDNKLTNDLQRLCLKVISGAESLSGDASAVTKVEKDLAVKKGTTVAAGFSDRYKRLCKEKTLSRPAQVVDFLHHVAVDNERTQTFNSGVKLSSTPLHAQLSNLQTPASLRPPTQHGASSITQLPTGLRDVTSHPPPSGRLHETVSGSSGLGTSRGSLSHTLTAAGASIPHSLPSHIQQTPQANSTPTNQTFTEYKRYMKEEVTELDLVKDVILVAQGIEGKLAKFDPKSDAYRIPDNYRIPLHKRNACYKLFEAGWLYNKIRTYIDLKKNDTTFGPIGLSFCVALQHEVRCYLRLISVLESQLTIPDPSDISKGLTLLRLLLWFKEPMENLILAACLVDVAKGRKGGALLSTIHSYTYHGSMRHTSLVNHALTLTVRPLFGVVERWIYTGHLEDPYNEFFVAADPQVKDENLWHFKYSLRKSMLPSFLTADMARKIMLTGKSVVFIHKVCGDNTQLDQREAIKQARLTDGSAMFTQDDDDSFKTMIDVAYKVTSKHLMEVLYTKYNFINHLKAMRRYLLLGQGDFIQQLMDLLVGELSKEASSLYLHNLNGILETAIRATNAQYEDKDILSRLDVRLLEISPGDLGWDVFSLDYRTRGPISTVFTQDTMIFYLRIFNFLWRAKRMEYALANLWRQKQQYSKMLRGMTELDELLHHAHVIASEMIHFTQQIGYYINFEVIECAWDDLLQKVNKAEDLDHIIAAHQQFLDSIITRCLMDQVHRDVFSQLRTIFDLIIKYQQILEGFLEKSSRENEYRKEFAKGKRLRTKNAEWEIDEECERQEQERRADFVQTTLKPARSQLKVLSQTYQDMVTKFLVMLATQADDKLQALRFRLDFNEYYQSKDPRLATPQVLKKTQPRTGASLSELSMSQPLGGLVGVLGGRVPEAVGGAVGGSN